MEKRYFLMNGYNRVGDALYLKSGSKIKKEFEDISSLDLITMDIKAKEAKEVLKETNHGKQLVGQFYDVGYPFNGEVRSFATIFDLDKSILNSYYDALKKYAEERSFNVKNGNKLSLNMDQQLRDYVYKILYSIIDNNIKCLANYDSLMSYRAKEIIKNKNKGANQSMSVGQYLDRNSIVLGNLYSNYGELRNLTIEYILYLAGRNTDIRNAIKRTEKWRNYGIERDANKEEIVEYKQMELSDFINAPKVKRIEKRRR